MIVAINEKARPYYEDNNLKYLQKKETIPPKRNHTEPVKSLPKTTETTHDKVLPNTLTKRIYQGQEIKSTTKEAFSNIPRDKNKGKLHNCTAPPKMYTLLDTISQNLCQERRLKKQKNVNKNQTDLELVPSAAT